MLYVTRQAEDRELLAGSSSNRSLAPPIVHPGYQGCIGGATSSQLAKTQEEAQTTPQMHVGKKSESVSESVIFDQIRVLLSPQPKLIYQIRLRLRPQPKLPTPTDSDSHPDSTLPCTASDDPVVLTWAKNGRRCFEINSD